MIGQAKAVEGHDGALRLRRAIAWWALARLAAWHRTAPLPKGLRSWLSARFVPGVVAGLLALGG